MRLDARTVNSLAGGFNRLKSRCRVCIWICSSDRNPLRWPGFLTDRDDEDDHRGGNGPESFDFLGFTFYWGRTRRGGQAVLRKTAKDRLARAITRTSAWCRDHLHDAIDAQHQTLCRAVQGHYAYYGVTGNSRQIGRFVRKVEEVWHKWLARRSNSRRRPWSWFAMIRDRFPLPPPRIVHKAMTSRA